VPNTDIVSKELPAGRATIRWANRLASVRITSTISPRRLRKQDFLAMKEPLQIRTGGRDVAVSMPVGYAEKMSSL
jgi:hypothetical protein